MNLTEQLKRGREVSDLKDKLQKINSNLSYYHKQTTDSQIAIEAYDLLRLEVLQELADMGEISQNSIS
jgi:hypothetical protein